MRDLLMLGLMLAAAGAFVRACQRLMGLGNDAEGAEQ